MSEEAADQLFLGRQPILDRNQQLFAYELLFRSNYKNYADFTDGVQATATVIINAFAELGIEAALGCYRAFINVDTDFLFSDLIEFLPQHAVVLEILETVPPTPEVIERCRILKTKGFTLALDDVIQYQPAYAGLIDLATILKIDIQPLSPTELTELVTRLHPLGKQLIAEKVDCREQMEHCLSLGFSLFQGYYFAKPTVIAGKKLEHSKLALLKLLQLVLTDADTVLLESILKLEPGLTINLLRMTNSVGAGARQKINSLRHAITVLGRRQLQRWLQLLVFSSRDQQNQRNPLLLLAATRGRLMELLASEFSPGNEELADHAFMVGIMSLMPAVIGLPIAEIIAPFGLANDVNDALCNGCGKLGKLLQLAESSENGNLKQMANNLNSFPEICPKALNLAQTRALQWANSIGQDKPE